MTMMRNLLIAAAMLACLNVATPRAAEPGALAIDQPWARATAPMQKNGAAYLVIRNRGAEPDRLLAVRGGIAGMIQLHSNTVDAQGVNRMREVEAIQVPAHGSVALQPGGLHVMLMQLQQPLRDGSHFPLTLVFEKAGEVPIEVSVQKSGPAMGEGEHMAH